MLIVKAIKFNFKLLKLLFCSEDIGRSCPPRHNIQSFQKLESGKCFTQSAILLQRRVLKWLRSNIGCSKIQGHYIFILFPDFYRFSAVFKYKNSLANWQKLPNICVSFQHPTKVARSMVYSITVLSVPLKHQLYKFKILNILIGIIMFIFKNTHSYYLFTK